jgi:hypothetical protein
MDDFITEKIIGSAIEVHRIIFAALRGRNFSFLLSQKRNSLFPLCNLLFLCVSVVKNGCKRESTKV